MKDEILVPKENTCSKCRKMKKILGETTKEQIQEHERKRILEIIKDFKAELLSIDKKVFNGVLFALDDLKERINKKE